MHGTRNLLGLGGLPAASTAKDSSMVGSFPLELEVQLSGLPLRCIQTRRHWLSGH